MFAQTLHITKFLGPFLRVCEILNIDPLILVLIPHLYIKVPNPTAYSHQSPTITSLQLRPRSLSRLYTQRLQKINCSLSSNLRIFNILNLRFHEQPISYSIHVTQRRSHVSITHPKKLPLAFSSFSSWHAFNFDMSYSNADTGSRPADHYKEKSLEKLPLKDNVVDLVAFVDKCKFCMMTTRMGSSMLLISCCMALAAKVCATLHPRISIHPA